VPLHARVFAACVVGYAFSPIDLIPDPIPILGYLDDLVLIYLGVALAIRMIPEPVLLECREKARRASGAPGRQTGWWPSRSSWCGSPWRRLRSISPSGPCEMRATVGVSRDECYGMVLDQANRRCRAWVARGTRRSEGWILRAGDRGEPIS
jgi:uncharacterized membrane protein YkvA (DUF1232 family)